MLRKLFDPDQPLMITLSRITDCIFLSLFWLLVSFPVVTLGAATTALYDGVYWGFRKKDRNPWIRFAKSLKRNWKASLLPGLVLLVVFGGLSYAVIQLWNAAVAARVSWMVFAAVAFGAVVVLGILSVLFPMLSRFENSLGALLKNTVFLSLANLPRTVGLGMINAVTLVMCVRFVIPVFILPAVATLLSTFLIEPMFKPYMTENEN